MNKQKVPHGIEWTRVYGRDGYTWNVLQGCLHGCQWRMPTGEIADCYAKSLAENFQSEQFMSKGFEHHYYQVHKLNEPLELKNPAGIFMDSFSDFFGSWVPENEIMSVLDIMIRAHWHTFQSLTKAAPNMLKYNEHLPPNLWAGASVPPTFFKGHELTPAQQAKMLHRTMEVLSQVRTPIRWLSIEPLSWDISGILESYPGAIQWAVIGAASNGKRKYQPKAKWVQKVLDVLDSQKVAVFFKGNLQWRPWREDFPMVAPKQMNMFERS